MGAQAGPAQVAGLIGDALFLGGEAHGTTACRSDLTIYYTMDKPGEPTCLMGIHWRLGGGG